MKTRGTDTLTATVTQWAIFAEAVAWGLAAHQMDPDGPAAAEIKAVTTEARELST